MRKATAPRLPAWYRNAPAQSFLLLPLMLKGIARMTNEGAFAQVYACDLNLTGFFPGLNDVVPIIVNAATPGGQAMYTPRCRSMANG